MSTAKIEERTISNVDSSGGASVSRMFQPESGHRAEMIAGGADEVADKIIGIFKELGVV